MFSFHLKHVFLFSHRDPDSYCPFESLISFILFAFPSWYLSTSLILLNNIDDNVSCSCSLLYIYPLKLPYFLSPSPQPQQSPPSFLNQSSLLSPLSNTPRFIFFTITYIINIYLFLQTTLYLIVHILRGLLAKLV